MRVDGERTFAAGQEVLWSLLHDPISLKQLLPGCESLTAAPADEYRGTLSIRIGQIVEQYEGTLRLEPIVPGRSYSFHAGGRNPDGAVNVAGRVTLHPEGPETTRLAYEADFAVEGRPALVSDRMLVTTARSFARRSLDALQHQVEIRTRTYTTTTAPPAHPLPPAPSTEDIERLVIRRRVMAVLSVLLALLIWRNISRRGARDSQPAPAASPLAIIPNQATPSRVDTPHRP